MIMEEEEEEEEEEKKDVVAGWVNLYVGCCQRQRRCVQEEGAAEVDSTWYEVVRWKWK